MPPARTRRTRAAAPAAHGRGPSEQARDHRRTRAARRTELIEDYVEIIADLIETIGEARVVDVAQRLGVSHVTVSKTVERLQREGFVTARPYRSIFLTDAGRRVAVEARRRHDLVVRFLRAIGVSESAAQTDAEGIEHHVSDETLSAFQRIAEARG